MTYQEIAKKENTLIAASLQHIDYNDAFTLGPIPLAVSSIDHFCTHYFRAQPVWLRLASMNTMSKQTLMRIIETNGFVKGGRIGRDDGVGAVWRRGSALIVRRRRSARNSAKHFSTQ